MSEDKKNKNISLNNEAKEVLESELEDFFESLDDLEEEKDVIEELFEDLDEDENENNDFNFKKSDNVQNDKNKTNEEKKDGKGDDELKNLEEIISFNFAKELGFEKMTEEELDEYNGKLFNELILRILEKTTEKLSPEDREKVFGMFEDEKIELGEIFNFIKEKNKDFTEDMGWEFIRFKKEIYQVLSNNNN